MPADAEGGIGVRPDDYILRITNVENACGPGLTNLHVVMLLTLPSDRQDVNVLSFFLHLGNPYIFLKASQWQSLRSALPSSVSLTPGPLEPPLYPHVAVRVVTMAQCNLENGDSFANLTKLLGE